MKNPSLEKVNMKPSLEEKRRKEKRRKRKGMKGKKRKEGIEE